MLYQIRVDLDEDLLDAWRSGDKAAGSQLLQRYFESVYRFFRTKLGDDVDDLVQQCFLGCVEGRDRVTAGEFRAYLFGIARNRLIDRLRLRQPVELDEECIAHCKTSPSQTVAKNQEQQLLMLAMQQIPINAQIVLELTYWEGLSGRELAQVLGVSEHTIRSRLARARDALRGKLAEIAPSAAAAESSWRALETAA